ncbi:AAA family ATPase [Microcoleus sp. herbarium7]|uniref:ATP-dependent nuclease n=1 Tax=Microcoleus sp. herbarium7 TaxID=3055435 RepID=UPI002FCF7607
MFISKFQLFNYKSFLDSGLLEFSPGINIIVGQNNSGKTALLEALSLNFNHEPHRSLKTLPSNSSRIDSKSSVEISLTCTKDEFHALIDQLPHHSVGISQPDDNTITPDEMVSLFQEWLDNPAPAEIIAFLSQRDSNDKRHLLIRDLNTKVILYHQIEDSSRTRLLKPDCKVISIGREENGRLIFTKDRFFQEVEDFLFTIYKRFQSKIYRFRAERLSLGSCSFGSSFELNPNASNLAEVINILQGRGKKNIFEQFNQYISIIFPEIKFVSVRPEPKKQGVISVPNSSSLEILVWSIEAAENDREDLAFPLAECGTGIGQVLAILYVVLTSQDPRTIIIDEPQSFLHPGAAKKLVDILKEFPQHQYFIATHSPMIIAAANPSTILKLRHEDGETKASMMNSDDVKEQRALLAELGISLSDVFGADSILWVEGPTEERCFPLILEKVAKKPLRGTQVLAVKNTGDLEGKRAHLIFDIYDKLSGGKSLFPPAVGFVLDREGRSERDIENFKRRSQNPIKFLPRRMYENYLLNPEAIAALINREDEFREKSLTSREVQEWLDKKQQEGLYLPDGVRKKGVSDSDWLCDVDGANLLKSLFTECSEARVEFSKTKHSFELTEWLVENEPDYLYELGEFLKEALNKLPGVSDG